VIFKNIGQDKPGIPTVKKKPHLGDLLLAKLRNRISAGFDDLERFELIDRLEKPVLNFYFLWQQKDHPRSARFDVPVSIHFPDPDEEGFGFVELAGKRGPSCRCFYFKIPQADQIYQRPRRPDPK
jgi:hypothetical protein